MTSRTSDRPTKAERREFTDRCRKLAQRDGKRIKYQPARWQLEVLDLEILWYADEAYLNVRVKHRHRNPCNETTSMVVTEHRTFPKWGFVDRLREHLELLRQLMVLDDLADV